MCGMCALLSVLTVPQQRCLSLGAGSLLLLLAAVGCCAQYASAVALLTWTRPLGVVVCGLPNLCLTLHTAGLFALCPSLGVFRLRQSTWRTYTVWAPVLLLPQTLAVVSSDPHTRAACCPGRAPPSSQRHGPDVPAHCPGLPPPVRTAGRGAVAGRTAGAVSGAAAPARPTAATRRDQGTRAAQCPVTTPLHAAGPRAARGRGGAYAQRRGQTRHPREQGGAATCPSLHPDQRCRDPPACFHGRPTRLLTCKRDSPNQGRTFWPGQSTWGKSPAGTRACGPRGAAAGSSGGRTRTRCTRRSRSAPSWPAPRSGVRAAARNRGRGPAGDQRRPFPGGGNCLASGRGCGAAVARLGRRAAGHGRMASVAGLPRDVRNGVRPRGPRSGRGQQLRRRAPDQHLLLARGPAATAALALRTSVFAGRRGGTTWTAAP